VPALAVIGHLSHDRIERGPPQLGGGPWHAGRAVKLLGREARLAAKCGPRDSRQTLLRLETLRLPVSLTTGGDTASFSFHYDERGHRSMTVDTIGEPWSPDDAVAAVERAEWVHVAPLVRTDFPAETLAALANGRKLLLDGQGLARASRTGPLVLDAEFDRDLLAHVSMLKLAEEEAVALVGSIDAIPELGVREVVVTRGPAGCVVFEGDRAEHVAAPAVVGDVDPTGAGDAFAVTYMSARARGRIPATAAWRAGVLVAGLLARTGR
jgi:sugar/nucleoside kinase (ribokinase family)